MTVKNQTLNFLRLIRSELYRYFKQRNYLISLIGIVVFTSFMIWLYSRSDLRVLKHGARLLKTDHNTLITGLHFAKVNVEYHFFILLPIFISLSGGMIYGSEAKKGLIKELLLFPVSRFKLLTVKFITLSIIILSLVFFLIIVSLTGGYLFYGAGPLVVYSSSDVHVIHPILMGQGKGLLYIAGSGMTIWYSLIALASVVFLISVIFNDSVSSSISGITFYFVCFLIGMQPQSGPIRKYLINDAMYTWKRIYYPDTTGVILKSALILSIYIIVSYLVSLVIFLKRDIR